MQVCHSRGRCTVTRVTTSQGCKIYKYAPDSYRCYIAVDVPLLSRCPIQEPQCGMLSSLLAMPLHWFLISAQLELLDRWPARQCRMPWAAEQRPLSVPRETPADFSSTAFLTSLSNSQCMEWCKIWFTFTFLSNRYLIRSKLALTRLCNNHIL